MISYIHKYKSISNAQRVRYFNWMRILSFVFALCCIISLFVETQEKYRYIYNLILAIDFTTLAFIMLASYTANKLSVNVSNNDYCELKSVIIGLFVLNYVSVGLTIYALYVSLTQYYFRICQNPYCKNVDEFVYCGYSDRQQYSDDVFYIFDCNIIQPDSVSQMEYNYKVSGVRYELVSNFLINNFSSEYFINQFSYCLCIVPVLCLIIMIYVVGKIELIIDPKLGEKNVKIIKLLRKK